MSITYKISEVRIPEPCDMDWDKMEVQADGNRFCDKCAKTVFDMAGKTDAEFNALVQAQGKSICLRFYSDQINLGPENVFASGRRPSPWLGRVASMAMVLGMLHGATHASTPPKALYQYSMSLSGPEKPPVDPAMLLTGVIVNESGRLVRQDLKISVLANGTQLKTIEVNSGLFQANLEDFNIEADSIELVVHPQINKVPRGRSFIHASRQVVPLNALQNVQFRIDEHFERALRIRLRKRRRGHTLGVPVF